nr:hypothetical protein [Tanacetum cinerariifolium]
MEIIEQAPEQGIQLALMESDYGETYPIEDELEWFVLGGDGEVDQTGIFTEPAPTALKDGVAIVMARKGPSSRDPFGFIALPLPLERFDRHAPRYARPRPILQARSARHAAPAKVHTAGKGVNSRDALLSWMQGKTVTYGWNALITYSRAKINRLLEHQYVTKFNTDSFLPPIFGTTCATTKEAVILVESLGESEITFTLTSNVDHGATLTPAPDKAGAYLYNPGTSPKYQITVDTAEFTDTATGAKA